MHVAPQTIPPLSALGTSLSGALESGSRAGFLNDLREELRLFVEPAAAGVQVSCEAVEGNIVAAILERIRSLDCDLLVVGTHGHDALEKLVLGSVTEKLLHKASCPVLTVPPAPEGETRAPDSVFRRILCPIDFSPASDEALAYAAGLAREDDGRVTLLHVVEGLADEPLDSHPDVAAALQHTTQRRRARLRHSLPDDTARWVDGEPLVATGVAYQEILRVADEMRADLIVMGVHGRSGFSLLLFGSNARHVVRGASCPVLALRPEVLPQARVTAESADVARR
jgi:nucleotide-binding universal stress UspA family protein